LIAFAAKCFEHDAYGMQGNMVGFVEQIKVFPLMQGKNVLYCKD
jgi:hypothetical protein